MLPNFLARSKACVVFSGLYPLRLEHRIRIKAMGLRYFCSQDAEFACGRHGYLVIFYNEIASLRTVYVLPAYINHLAYPHPLIYIGIVVIEA